MLSGDGGGDGSSGSGDGAASGSGGGSGGRGGDTDQPSRIAPPKVFAGTFLPPLLRPVTLDPTTPTTVDEGFSEQLPYGDRTEPADLPGDGFASIFTEGHAATHGASPIRTDWASAAGRLAAS